MFIEFSCQHVAVKMFSLLFRKRTPKRMSSIKRDLDARARSDAFRLILLFFVKDIRSPDVRLLINMSGLSSSEVRPWVRVLVETNDLSAPVYIYC